MANPNPNYPPYGGSQQQGGYGQPPSLGYGPPGTGAGYGQSGAAQGGYGQPGAAPGGYGAPQAGAPPGGYGQPGAASGGYGAPQSGALPGGYGAPQPGAPPGGYGAPQSGAPPGGYGAPQPGAPPGGYGAPQPGAPSRGYGAPQPGGSYGYPQPGAPGQAPGWGGGGGGGGGAAGTPPGVDPQVYQWFMSVDQDRSGRINMFELQQALTNANWTHFNAETCRLMIGLFDRDQSGQIELQEFQALWSYITQWRTLFEQFDRDRSGSIDANELNTALNQLGYRVSPQFSQMVVFRYDPLAKQRLTLDNFIQACVLLKTVTDTFRQKDTQMKGAIQVSYEEFLTIVLLNKP